MEDLFSIGEVSKFQNISKQTLIFYDKIGLFRPAYVDPENGYRYYSSGQIDYLDTIMIMKRIGFSLAEIREHMRDYNIDSSLAALSRQVTSIDSQIRELRLIRSRLVHRCEQMERAKEDQERGGGVRLEEVAARDILVQKVEEPYSLREISIASKKCFVEAAQKDLPIFFECGVVVPLERILAGRYTEASLAFLPIGRTDRTDHIQRLPAGRCASLYHVGDYQSVGRSYTRLLEYCRDKGLRVGPCSYEFCVNDHITSGETGEYMTKIMFYVEEG